ncbi:MAG: DUF4157 domain-containing protein [Acetatifactor sp.]|nr:DUF4157 domain-containing protein [Acetatifactor sp.]
MVSVSIGRRRRQERTKATSGSTGIPGAVQAKFEAASGLSFEDVRVHYNSSRPAQLGAYAYTRGNQVYIGPGQERHLEHELGHVVQQKCGLVKADGYINGVPVNRDPGLERAADLGANQPVQGFWKSLCGVAQMASAGLAFDECLTERETIWSGRDRGVSGRPAAQMMMRAGGEQAGDPAEVGEAAHAVSAITPGDLYAFGNRAQPRRARPQQDFGVDSEEQDVGPEIPPFPKGASTFSNVDGAPLTGHYHKLPGGTQLPNGLGVVADGRDVHADLLQAHGAGHHTIFPTVRMQVRQFNDLFTGLPWQYEGQKRPERQRQAGGQRQNGRQIHHGGAG